MSFHRILVFIVFIISFVELHAQTHVISPFTFNYFQGVQEFPDSLIRIFMTNKKSNAWQWDFAQSSVVGSNLKTTVTDNFKDEAGGQINIPAERMYVLNVPGGPTVIGIDQFHCDIDVPSVIAFVSDSGFITREVTIDENGSWNKIQKFGLVRPDIIGVWLEWNAYYFDLQGNRVQFPEIQEIYTNAILLGTNYYGSIDNKIYKLGPNFQLFDFQFTSDSIINIYTIQENKILVVTSKEVLIYSDQLELLHSNLTLKNIFVAKQIDDRIWVGAEEGLFELDTLLQLLHIYPDSIYKYIRWLGDWKDSLFVLTQVDGIDHTEIGLKKFGKSQAVDLIGPDISITQIVIPDDLPIVHSIYCPSNPGLFYDHLQMTVTNHSEEVVSAFKIGCDFGGDYQCSSFQKVWNIDTVMILPHESVDIFIDSFTMNCIIPEGKEFCAWTFSPNNTPDSNPLNDRFCDTISILNTNVPNEQKLMDVTYADTYKSYQILPDGTIRFFWHSTNSYPEIMYADLQAGESLEHVVPVVVKVPESYYWNWSSDDFVSMAFADGSTLLMNTTYECDVAVPGAIVKLKKDGNIDWFNDVADEMGDFGFRAGKMMFLDADRIGIQYAYGNESKSIIIDRNGNLLSYQETTFPYDETIETDSGFLAGKESELFILDSTFQPEQVYTLAGIISQIWPQEGNEFIIKAGSRFYELDSMVQLKMLELGNKNYDVVWKSMNYYFAVDSAQRTVYVYLKNFPNSFIHTIVLPPGVNPQWGVSSGYNIFVLTQYLSVVSTGVLMFTGGETNLHFWPQHDIGITNIVIPDTVEIYYLSNGIFGNGWYHDYEYVFVEVFNYGLDTVSNFFIQDPIVEECFMCSQNIYVWEVDSISIPPGESVSIALGAFQPKCQYLVPGNLCLHAFGPNHQADRNYLNDSACQPFSIFISAEDILPSNTLFIKPNPTSDEVFLTFDQQMAHNIECTVFDVMGNVVEQFKVTEDSHSLVNYPPGIFLFVLNDENRIIGSQRIVKLDQ